MIGLNDVVLIIVVSAQATLLAYLRHPMWKALVYTLPFPFTFAVLALGQPIDATNVIGMVLMLGYMHSVRILYRRAGVPIVIAIVASAVGYCVVGWLLADRISHSDLAFWLSIGVMVLLATILSMTQSHRDEPGHRSPLPVWLKCPMIVVVITLLVLMKQELRGFMTMFPMVGVIAAYEARHSLWTICRQIPVLMFAVGSLMAVSHLTQTHVGLGPSLAIGWVAYLGVLIPISRSRWPVRSKDG
jgi:hypothetical protein